jgi:hypothetical protein
MVTKMKKALLISCESQLKLHCTNVLQPSIKRFYGNFFLKRNSNGIRSWYRLIYHGRSKYSIPTKTYKGTNLKEYHTFRILNTNDNRKKTQINTFNNYYNKRMDQYFAIIKHKNYYLSGALKTSELKYIHGDKTNINKTDFKVEKKKYTPKEIINTENNFKISNRFINLSSGITVLNNFYSRLTDKIRSINSVKKLSVKNNVTNNSIIINRCTLLSKTISKVCGNTSNHFHQDTLTDKRPNKAIQFHIVQKQPLSHSGNIETTQLIISPDNSEDLEKVDTDMSRNNIKIQRLVQMISSKNTFLNKKLFAIKKTYHIRTISELKLLLQSRATGKQSQSDNVASINKLLPLIDIKLKGNKTHIVNRNPKNQLFERDQEMVHLMKKKHTASENKMDDISQKTSNITQSKQNGQNSQVGFTNPYERNVLMSIDVNSLAENVYKLIENKIKIERERRGILR